MFKSMTSNDVPRTKETIEGISISDNAIDDDSEFKIMFDANIEPRRSVFCYEICTLIVQYIASRRVCCKFVQSCDESHPIDNNSMFYKIDEVKEIIIETLMLKSTIIMV